MPLDNYYAYIKLHIKKKIIYQHTCMHLYTLLQTYISSYDIKSPFPSCFRTLPLQTAVCVVQLPFMYHSVYHN